MSGRDYFSITDPVQREQARMMISKLQSKILYSDKYYDDEYEYRHVILPKDFSRLVPRGRLMEESEWRQLGVQQSVGWRHYMLHAPEPHVLLFKRPKTQ
ncbi:cyclin dependent kinases regulatory subunit, putative [Trypanosoma equiperdum]|uniref:Cyclin-dependent kinases regulatory subunit n=5 Tax=Trypanozoon TaxID=39700 RepID=Q381E7_TRYB2|nr:cyclin dependant kinases regulatory subunit,putative [Trypanosoma brucei gambiense DAL972]XP_829696.1 cyclin dependant kinase regulatory subunit [Trypanosoma brucei brucei TREU927]RHW68106.1 cyclin dependent kinases regulatory subunit [Trypanosoma brucei equiperdum]CAD43044.1 cyclin dependant kinases regulatory subunit [Trypanosoma brucei]SCU67340.1 cyclin dependent kinases regulatory subunit, putative [Trypanosoma equiperdum]EAN80584.1 cyclin dependant kinases regulatory subunit, putative |eukprot:XP_011780987.1 cyclin dependant kinases regulatory subunit,putative [Trypanosoma brucei gambiense DAL972]